MKSSLLLEVSRDIKGADGHMACGGVFVISLVIIDDTEWKTLLQRQNPL